MATISYQDFVNNFTIKIKSIRIPHIDETGNYPASVGLLVICKKNTRIGYFEYHFTDTEYVSNATQSTLVNYAWSQLKTNIQTWATDVISLAEFYNYPYVPTVEFSNTYPNLNLSSYNQNFTTFIQRFEPVPSNDPVGWCVGFNSKNNNNDDHFYVDTVVNISSFNIPQLENSIINDAWLQIKDVIATWASEHLSIVDNSFVPTEF